MKNCPSPVQREVGPDLLEVFEELRVHAGVVCALGGGDLVLIPGSHSGVVAELVKGEAQVDRGRGSLHLSPHELIVVFLVELLELLLDLVLLDLEGFVQGFDVVKRRMGFSFASDTKRYVHARDIP